MTGVGIGNSSDQYYAPSNYHRRWDNEGYMFTEDDRLTYIMEAEVGSENYAFLVHAACWNVTCEFFGGRERVPLARLVELCKSYSAAFKPLDFVYENRMRRRIVDHFFPWNILEGGNPLSGRENISLYNPSDISRYLSPLIQAARLDAGEAGLDPPAADQEHQWIRSEEHCESCPFDHDMMPFEMLEEIVSHLSVSDVLHLRHTCKRFVPFFDYQRFWKACFKRDGEAGFAFEVLRESGPLDYRALFAPLTKIDHAPGELLNRRRTWSMLRTLDKMIPYTLGEVPAAYMSAEQDYLDSSSARVEGLMHHRRLEWQHGCHEYYTQSVELPCEELPSDILRTWLSTIKLGRYKYLSGIRIMTKAGESLCLGYQGGEQILLDGDQIARGFAVAVDEIGIREILPADQVTDDYKVEHGAVTLRLATDTYAKQLTVGLDVSPHYSRDQYLSRSR